LLGDSDTSAEEGTDGRDSTGAAHALCMPGSVVVTGAAVSGSAALECGELPQATTR
jgi:hypothetical protein